jgi:hypothetical protein
VPDKEETRPVYLGSLVPDKEKTRPVYLVSLVLDRFGLFITTGGSDTFDESGSFVTK